MNDQLTQFYKLGVISDIHADCEALDLALQCLAARDVHSVVCGGDLVEKGTGGDAVVATLRNRAIPVIQGNHDKDAISNQQWLRENTEFPDHPLLLQPQTLQYLQTLPKTLYAKIKGVSILVAHGTPLNVYRYLHPYNLPERYHDVIQSTDAQVIILGHTHRPMYVTLAGRHIVNPGSVCGSRLIQGSRTCGVLKLPRIMWDVYSIDTGQNVTPEVIDY